MSDMQLLQQDYQLITMVHGQAIKQVSLQQYTGAIQYTIQLHGTVCKQEIGHQAVQSAWCGSQV